MRFHKVLDVVLIAAMAFMTFMAALAYASANPAQDFAQYWTAAHLARQNPYSVQGVINLERSAGILGSTTPMVLRNPPWAVVLVLPLSLVSYPVGYAAWTLLSIVVVAGCARAAWKLFDPAPSVAPALLCLLFGPTVVLLMLGQLTVLVLLGVTLFLTMVERKRDWLAGASFLLLLLKPHVLALFLLAVSLWTIRCKRWAILVSAVLTLTTASVAALAINPHIFSQYRDFAGQFAREVIAYPNLGGLFFTLTGRHSLAFRPQLLGVVWSAFYWYLRRASWDWKTDGVLVLLVSVCCSYYSFPYDQVLALPALIGAFADGNRRVFLAGFLVTNLGYAAYISNIAGHFGFNYLFLWWTASGWLITYLLSRGPTPHVAPASSL